MILFDIDDDTMYLIDKYTFEAGVRNLKRKYITKFKCR